MVRGATRGYRAGFAAVLGWTNVGKSTLLNRILAQKIVITSRRTQTTRYATSVVLSEERGQIIFIDTPGFHEPRNLLGEMMLREASAALMNSDLGVHIVSPDVKAEQKPIRDLLEKFRGPRVLVVNKLDLLDGGRLAAFLAGLPRQDLYDDIVPVSAATGENVPELLETLLARLPQGAPLFPEDEISDRNERFFMGEIIREKVVRLTRQELPHATAVVVEQSRRGGARGIWHISATVYVEKESQKGIIIGARGGMLKEIGRAARRELEVFLQGGVFLELWVKVRKNWTRDPVFLREIGYAGRG